MNIPTWVKPAILGGIVGAVGTMVIGFNAIGWMSASSADKLVFQKSRVAVIDALVPICLSQQKKDPDSSSKLTQLVGMKTSYEQRDFVMTSGWATMPEASEPDRDVASQCADVLAKAPQT
jgi:hypothetical protein